MPSAPQRGEPGYYAGPRWVPAGCRICSQEQTGSALAASCRARHTLIEVVEDVRPIPGGHEGILADDAVP
jgi:hypothetical protein